MKLDIKSELEWENCSWNVYARPATEAECFENVSNKTLNFLDQILLISLWVDILTKLASETTPKAMELEYNFVVTETVIISLSS